MFRQFSISWESRLFLQLSIGTCLQTWIEWRWLRNCFQSNNKSTFLLFLTRQICLLASLNLSAPQNLNSNFTISFILGVMKSFFFFCTFHNMFQTRAWWKVTVLDVNSFDNITWPCLSQGGKQNYLYFFKILPLCATSCISVYLRINSWFC